MEEGRKERGANRGEEGAKKDKKLPVTVAEI